MVVDANEVGGVGLNAQQARAFFAEAIGSVVKALIAGGTLTPEAVAEMSAQLWQKFGGDDSPNRNEVRRLLANLFPYASIASQ